MRTQLNMSASTKVLLPSESNIKEQSPEERSSLLFSEYKPPQNDEISFYSPSDMFEECNQGNKVCLKNDINLLWLANSTKSISRCRFLPLKYKNFLIKQNISRAKKEKARITKKRKRLFTPIVSSKPRLNRLSMSDEQNDNCGDENDEKERTKDIDSSMKLNAETTDNQNIDNFYYTRDYCTQNQLQKEDTSDLTRSINRNISRQKKMKICSSSAAVLRSSHRLNQFYSKIKSKNKASEVRSIISNVKSTSANSNIKIKENYGKKLLSPHMRDKITQNFRYKRIKRLSQKASKHFYEGSINILTPNKNKPIVWKDKYITRLLKDK